MEGLFLGLLTGQGCLIGCAPYLIPYLMEEGKVKPVFYFLGGRFLSYLCLAIVAFLCQEILSSQRNLFLACSYIGLSLLLIFRFKTKKWNFCANRFIRCSKPLLLGLFTALSFCPTLLLAFTSAAKKNSVLEAIIFFILFFMGSSLYFLPLTLIAKLKKFPFIQHIGKMSSYVVGVIYLLIGIYQLFEVFV